MTTEELHDHKVRDLAEQYRQQGYEVTLEPSPDAIPGFEPNLRPDLLAKKDRDQVVVEVKSRGGLRNSDTVRRMADALAHKPDWRFELVVLEDSGIELNPSVSADAIHARLASADLLLKHGDAGSAFILVWIAAETALRKLALANQLPINDASPARLIRELSFNGVIDRDDYDFLNKEFHLRNQIVHGLEAPSPTVGNVEMLRKLVARLIEDSERHSAAA